MALLEDTTLSCVAGLTDKEGGEISSCFQLSFLVLLQKWDGLIKVLIRSVNVCPAALSVSSSGVFCLLCDPDRPMGTVLSEVAAWQLPPFPC